MSKCLTWFELVQLREGIEKTREVNETAVAATASRTLMYVCVYVCVYGGNVGPFPPPTNQPPRNLATSCQIFGGDDAHGNLKLLHA